MKNIPFAHPSWIEIDLMQFKRNISLIRDYIGGKKICIPIKANGYGHGIVPIAKAAVEAEVDYIAVAYLQEAIILREAGIHCPIIVLGVIYEEQVELFVEYDIEATVSSLAKAQLVARHLLTHSQPIKVHVEVDIGMRRTGTRIESTESVLDYLDSQPLFEIAGVYSHLPIADLPDKKVTSHQIKLFTDFVTQTLRPRYPDALFHLANSGGICFYPESHLDMVRPGKLVFGHFDTDIQALSAILPVISIKSKVAFFKVVKAGEGISYGHTYHVENDSRIVTVPIGYGDGYRRSLSNQAEVLIRGKRYPVVGTICMDQFMVNVGQDEVYVGDEVVLVGHQGDYEITFEALAIQCNTIASELLCNFNERLPHYYKGLKEEYWEYQSLKQNTLSEL